MKTKLSCTLLALALGCASGEAPGPLDAKLDQAAATWTKDKASCSTYHYVQTSASFSGVTRHTTIEISEGRPTRRHFVSQSQENAPEQANLEWDETGAAVGSHQGAFEPKTVDQLFADCRQIIAHDPKVYDLQLMVGDHGVPTLCVYLPRGCSDDCDVGFYLSSFACGPLAP